MNILIDRNALTKALALVVPHTNAHGTSPVLACVLIRAAMGKVTMSTTNQKADASVVVDATVADPGEVCVDAARLLTSAKTLSSGVVTLHYDGKRLTVSQGSTVYRLSAIDGAEFPVAIEVTGSSVTLDGTAFAKAVSLMQHAIAGDDNRYGLNGVHFDTTEGAIRLVATDGNRLAYATCPGDLAVPRQMLVPAGILRAVPASADLVITVADRAIRFAADGFTLSGRLLEADFPDYRQVLPASFKRRLVMPSADLVDAIKRVAPFAGDSSSTVVVTIAAGVVSLKARKLDAGDASTEVSVDYDGGAFTVGANAVYLLQAVQACGASVCWESGGELSPMRITDPDNAGMVQIVMPVRVE